MKKSILVINPGSTSTKIAVYNGLEQLFFSSISHPVDELQSFNHVHDQLDYRYQFILKSLSDNNISFAFAIVMGRGGMLPPVDSGIYEVNDAMLTTLREAQYGEHASNLGAFLASKVSARIPGCRAYIADPVSVDELEEVARISGLPQMPRQSVFHALNHKAVGRHHALQIGKKYEDLNLIIAHLGGGVSVGAHNKGRVIDVNQGLNGYGPISPERSGTLDASKLVKLCFSGAYTEKQTLRLLAGQGGFTAHFGTNNVQTLEQQALLGDEKVKLVLRAMAYTVGKEIGAMFAVMKADVDAVILTGGVAHCQYIVDEIKAMIEPFSLVFVYPGEDEMGSLAANGLRLLNGEQPKEFKLMK